MRKLRPAWLDEARRLCRQHGIAVIAWGPEQLCVQATADDRIAEYAALLAPIGLKPLKDEDDAKAGILTLAYGAATPALAEAAGDLARDLWKRPWGDQVEPLIWTVCAILLFRQYAISMAVHQPPVKLLSLVVVLLLAAIWDGLRVWGWQLEIRPEGVGLRQRFRASLIGWEQISGIESEQAGRTQERVTMQTRTGEPIRLGKFSFPFARSLRDRLRAELAQRKRPV